MDKTEKFVPIEELSKLRQKLIDLSKEAERGQRRLGQLHPINSISICRAEYEGYKEAFLDAAILVAELIDTGVCDEKV